MPHMIGSQRFLQQLRYKPAPLKAPLNWSDSGVKSRCPTRPGWEDPFSDARKMQPPGICAVAERRWGEMWSG